MSKIEELWGLLQTSKEEMDSYSSSCSVVLSEDTLAMVRCDDVD